MIFFNTAISHSINLLYLSLGSKPRSNKKIFCSEMNQSKVRVIAHLDAIVFTNYQDSFSFSSVVTTKSFGFYSR